MPGAFAPFSSSMARPASFSHAENQPRNPRSPGWVLKLKTRRSRVKKGARKCAQLPLCGFPCKKLNSQLDPLFTIPNPLWASARSSFCAFRARGNTFAARAETVMRITLEKIRFRTQIDTETRSNMGHKSKQKSFLRIPGGSGTLLGD